MPVTIKHHSSAAHGPVPAGLKQVPKLHPPKVSGKFVKGQSGNPTGRPSGVRNKATLALEALLEGEAEAITRKCVNLAKAGDLVAIKLCIDRLLPVRRSAKLNIKLPQLRCAADISEAALHVPQMLAKGLLSIDEASSLTSLLTQCHGLAGAIELDRRLRSLEEQNP